AGWPLLAGQCALIVGTRPAIRISSAPMATVEVEARFRVGPGCSAADVVAMLGVELSEPVHQDDQAYAPKGWHYGLDRVQVTFARLRSEGEHCLFTVKRPVTDVRTCIEYECGVDDRDAMHR